MQVKIIQGCLNQYKNHAPLIESHGLTEVGSATDLPKGGVWHALPLLTDFLKCSCTLKISSFNQGDQQEKNMSSAESPNSGQRLDFPHVLENHILA